MPENPAGLGFPEKRLVHFTKMPKAPYARYYYALRYKPGWWPSGIWHTKCRTEVFVNGDTEVCACGVSAIDLAKNLGNKKAEPAITKLF